MGSEWTSEACAIPRCPHQAGAALRLLIDGYDAILPMCERHAHWLDAYVEEDAKVRLVGRLPKATQEVAPRTALPTRSDVSASGELPHVVR